MDQVFLQIFNTALTAGWLVLAVILARLLLKKAPAWIKCALWAIVAVRLVWPFSFESVLSLLPSVETIPPSQLYEIAPQVNTGISSLNAAINPVFTETFRSEPVNSVNPLQVAASLAGWVWVLGMVAMAVYAAISYLRIRRRVRVNVPEGEGVYLCDQIPAPFILGILKPKIYLPADLPREKWDSILAHERAHLVRRDHWWKPLGFALLTVFWFHPLLWVAYILLCRDVELACDERVIKSLTAEEKQDYSNTLLECSIPGRWITACPLAFGETGVKQRIKAVLHYKKPALWILIIALIACSVLAVGFLTDPVKHGKIPTTPPLGVYVREIEEDRFIGTDENGNRWEIEAVAEKHWLGQVVWVTLDGEPQVMQAPTQDTPGSYKVKPARVWNTKDCDLIDYGFAHDVGSFDIDHDGILEQCVLSSGPTSGMVTFELSVWSGKTREASVIFYSNTSKNAAALYAEDGALKILTPDQAYQEENWHMHIYDVSFDNGTLIVSENGEPLDILSQANVAGKTYIYEKEGFGGDFSIYIYENGTFQYYVGMFSSHIGMGTWEIKNDKLILHEDTPSRIEEFTFKVEADALVFVASESSGFGVVDVADGMRFYMVQNPEAEQNPRRNLMWVEVESCGKDHLYALDGDGNRWKILTEEVDTDSFLLNRCWVSYCEEPIEINERLPGGKVVRYLVTAEKCWAQLNSVPGIEAGSIFLPYDYCYYDIDHDGVTEVCVLSGGRTSGLSTFKFSVWENGVCEFERSVYEGAHSYSAAFVLTESGLGAVTSVGKYFYFLYANGAIRVTSEGLLP